MCIHTRIYVCDTHRQTLTFNPQNLITSTTQEDQGDFFVHY